MFCIEGEALTSIKPEPVETEINAEFNSKCEAENDNVKIEWLSPDDYNINETDELLAPYVKQTFESEIGYTPKSEITYTEYQISRPDSIVVESLKKEEYEYEYEVREIVAYDGREKKIQKTDFSAKGIDDDCDKKFSNKSNLNEHKRIVHNGEKPYACNEKFGHQHALKQHKLFVHSGGKPFCCDKCGTKFASKSRFNEHKQVHGEKSFACNECHKKFYIKRILIEHERIHTGEKPFACNVCEKRFLKKCNLNEHKRTRHADEKSAKPFVCNECPRRFVRKSYLIKHKLVHNNEKRFASSEKSDIGYTPNYKIDDEFRETRNEKRIEDEKKFACDDCDKKFRSKFRLKEHKLIHSERSFACKECDKKFYLKRVLNEHERIHTGERPFACDQCDRTFSKKCNLNEHKQVIHIGEKPFACNVCEKRFLRKHKLNLHHERMHHTTGEKQFEIADTS